MEIVGNKVRFVLTTEELEVIKERDLVESITSLIVGIESTSMDVEFLDFDDAMLMIEEALNTEAEDEDYNDDDIIIDELFGNLIKNTGLDYI